MENIKCLHKYSKSKHPFFGRSACVMRQNWKELPDFIEFCNKLDAPVYFHSVWFPPQSSVWNLDSNSLKEIYEFLSGLDFPEANPVQKKNLNHYKDTVKLIFQWWKDAEKRETERENFRKLKNMPDSKQTLYNRVKEHVQNMPNLSEEDKNQKILFYFSKMNNVIDRLPIEFPLEKAFENINNVMIEALVAELEVNSEERILQQALSFGSGI